MVIRNKYVFRKLIPAFLFNSMFSLVPIAFIHPIFIHVKRIYVECLLALNRELGICYFFFINVATLSQPEGDYVSHVTSKG